MTESRRNDLFAAAVLASVPIVVFIDVVLGLGAFYRGDAASYFYPIRTIVRGIVLAGEFPFWNPMYGAGQPLAANPAYELFYPLNWLTFLPGFSWTFHLVALLHIHIAAFSTYALLRSLGTGRAAACAGGLSFGVGGFALSGLHLFPILFSAAWMPLTCLFTRRFLRERRPRDFAVASTTLGLQLLIGEPVTVLQTGLLLGLYALFRGERRSFRTVARDVVFVGLISIAALGVSAVQTLPMLDHYRDSARAHGFDFSHVAAWSTPPLRLVETIYPGFFGSARADGSEPYWGSKVYRDLVAGFFPSIYSGLLVTLLAIAGVVARVRGWLLATVTIATSIVLAAGDQTPLLRLLYDAGIARSLRYPEKFLMLGIFALVVFGSVVLDRLLAGDARVRRIAVTLSAITAVVAAIALYVASGTGAEESFRAHFQIEGGVPAAEMLDAFRRSWLIAIARAILLALVIAATARLPKRSAVAMILLFVIADLAPAAADVAPRTSRSFYTDPPEVLRRLPADHAQYRILIPENWASEGTLRAAYLYRRPEYYLLQRNALIGLTPAIWGVRTAAGRDFDRTMLTSTTNFLAAAQRIAAARPDGLSYIAAMSNVRYLGVYQPLERELVRTRGDVTLVEPVRLMEGRRHPRYYFAKDVTNVSSLPEFVAAVASGRYHHSTAFIDGTPFRPAAGRVLRSRATSNSAQIEVETDGRAFLVMSVTPHKYWQIAIDGAPAEAVVTNVGYQGVVVPAGRHVVEMRYSNPLVAAGAGLSMAALLILLAIASRSSPPPLPAFP